MQNPNTILKILKVFVVMYFFNCHKKQTKANTNTNKKNPHQIKRKKQQPKLNQNTKIYLRKEVMSPAVKLQPLAPSKILPSVPSSFPSLFLKVPIQQLTISP